MFLIKMHIRMCCTMKYNEIHIVCIQITFYYIRLLKVTQYDKLEHL